MTEAHDNKDTLKTVESIFDEAKRKIQPFLVELPVATGRYLWSALEDEAILLRAFQDSEERKRLSFTENERMLHSLRGKFRKKLDPRLITREGGKYPKSVFINLTGKDMDFLNRILVTHVDLNRQAGREEWFNESGVKKIIDVTPEENMQETKELMAALVSLNDAFVKAGGSSPSEYKRFRGTET